jgi:cysteine synthase
MIAEARRGSIVTLICDPGERYLGTYYNADWIAQEGLDPRLYRDWLERFSA